MSSKNLTFKVNWVGDSHIVVAFKKQEEDNWNEFLMTVREYAEFMSLMQEFNMAFKEQLDQKIIESYYNE
jgi:hypothetical protein